MIIRVLHSIKLLPKYSWIKSTLRIVSPNSASYPSHPKKKMNSTSKMMNHFYQKNLKPPPTKSQKKQKFSLSRLVNNPKISRRLPLSRPRILKNLKAKILTGTFLVLLERDYLQHSNLNSLLHIQSLSRISSKLIWKKNILNFFQMKIKNSWSPSSKIGRTLSKNNGENTKDGANFSNSSTKTRTKALSNIFNFMKVF